MGVGVYLEIGIYLETEIYSEIDICLAVLNLSTANM